AGRLQTAAEVAGLLEGYLAHLRQPLTAPVPNLPPRQTRRLLWTPRVLGLTAAVLLVGLAVAVFFQPPQPQPGPKLRQEYRLSFKGASEDTPGLALVGPGAAECVRFEPEGLRITLPTGWNAVRDNTGVRLAIRVKGDFEMTMPFEILKEPKPEEGAE